MVWGSAPGSGHPSPQVGEAIGPPDLAVNVTHAGGRVRPDEKSFTMPHFDPASVESSPGFLLGARLKVRLARLQMEREDREREFQLHKELELKKLEAETTIRIRELELREATTSSPATVSESSTKFDVSKNISLVPRGLQAAVSQSQEGGRSDIH